MVAPFRPAVPTGRGTTRTFYAVRMRGACLKTAQVRTECARRSREEGAHLARTHPEQARGSPDARRVPRPGPGQLGRLVGTFEPTDLNERMIREDAPRRPAPEADPMAYRIAQEASADLAEHASPSTAPRPGRRLRDHHPRPCPPPLPDAQKPVTHGTGTMRRQERTP